jgi:hypothetical protein
MLAILNIQLCLSVVKNNKDTSKEWNDIVSGFADLWSKAGSPGKKLAELEHLKFLIFGLKTAIKRNEYTFLPYLDVMTLDDLEKHMDELKNSLTELQSKKK